MRKLMRRLLAACLHCPRTARILGSDYEMIAKELLAYQFVPLLPVVFICCFTSDFSNWGGIPRAIHNSYVNMLGV